MSNSGSTIASICLVLGALLGMAGTFLPSESLRGLAWGFDGALLVIAGAILFVQFLRQQQDLVAAGFLVFTVGQGLVLSSAPMSLEAGGPAMASGAMLWSVSLAMVSGPRVMPTPVRVLGLVACGLFAAFALQVFSGRPLTALSRPLPFVAYPFLVLTMFGWAWSCRRL